MFESLQKLNDAKKKFEDDVKANGKTIIKDALAEFFNLYPEVESIRWHQYTPYFNDGEPCTFGVGDVTGRLHGVTEGGDYDDGYEYRFCPNDKSDWGREEIKKRGLTEADIKNLKRLDEGLSALATAIHGLADALEYVFGDGVEITATVNGIEIADYDHD